MQTKWVRQSWRGGRAGGFQAILVVS